VEQGSRKFVIELSASGIEKFQLISKCEEGMKAN
jgi:hypothetical protein